MKRRDALKNLGLAAGFAITAPSIFSLLQSCTSAPTWMPAYFSKDEKEVVVNLVDIILPKTEGVPSATEVNVPQFIDKYITEVLNAEDQEAIRISFTEIIATLKPTVETDIRDVTTAQYTALLDANLLVKGDIDKDRLANPEALQPTKNEFLNHLKYLTIMAYVGSEEIGENVLMYDPVPTAYYCGDLQEISGGKSSSL
ncbi:gluconate 2-dehydrogenase subunit 3 family protein [uncultured Polaribacter sp.]|uniref:gluconate 2-dehydrogenase subunit 3 family protein n=1 Tax=uncultured Polaribacter sp. TaxID=174711 RepID=UPI00236D5899|nr:gluconate 2-dehydrogenase subunit 3 family protein [Polaribacter sp.]